MLVAFQETVRACNHLRFSSLKTKYFRPKLRERLEAFKRSQRQRAAVQIPHARARQNGARIEILEKQWRPKQWNREGEVTRQRNLVVVENEFKLVLQRANRAARGIEYDSVNKQNARIQTTSNQLKLIGNV